MGEISLPTLNLSAVLADLKNTAAIERWLSEIVRESTILEGWPAHPTKTALGGARGY
jgi:hypothetical protein